MLTLQQMTQDLYGFTSPPIPADCAAQYQGADAWMCLWPSNRLPYVQTPYFLNAAQFDGAPRARPVSARALTCSLNSFPNHVRHEQLGQHVLLRNAA